METRKTIVVIKIILLIVLVFWCALFLARTIDLANSDIGRHLKNGEILYSGNEQSRENILHKNVYSYTHPNNKFINHHWGSGVVFYFVWSMFGFVGLSLLYIILCLFGFLVVFFVAWKESSFWFAYIVAIVAAPLIGLRYEIRPEMITYLLCPIIFWILWTYRKGTISFYWLFAILPMLVIWINFNLYFVFGLFLISIFWFDLLIKYLRSKKSGKNKAQRVLNEKLMFLSLLGVGGFLVLMLNPWGIRGVFYPLIINTQIEMQVYELASPFVLKQENNLHQGFASYFILLAVQCIFLTLILMKKFRSKFSFVIFTWTLTLILLSIMQARNVALFGLFSIPLIAIMGNAVWNVFRERILDSDSMFHEFFVNKRFVSVICSASILFLFLLITAFNHRHILNLDGTLGLGLKENNLSSLKCFAENDLQGPIFNDFDISSYLIFGLYPSERVFVDHRPEAYPPEFFQQTLYRSLNNEEFWKSLEDQYGFESIVLTNNPAYSKINLFINKRIQDPNWNLVCINDQTYIMKRL